MCFEENEVTTNTVSILIGQIYAVCMHSTYIIRLYLLPHPFIRIRTREVRRKVKTEKEQSKQNYDNFMDSWI